MASCNPRPLSRPNGNSTAVVDLLIREFYQTQVNGATWDSYVITGEDFEPIGPGLVDLVLHSETEGYLTSFSYRVRLETKMRDGSWGNPPGGALVIFGPVTTALPQVSAVFADRTKIGLAIRLVLDIQNTAAAALVSSRLSISVAVRRYCGC